MTFKKFAIVQTDVPDIKNTNQSMLNNIINPAVLNSPVALTTDMPRAYTQEEVRSQFLAKVRSLAQYWSYDVSPSHSFERRVSGCCHSILSVIDGSAVDMPGFKLIPNPHPSDKEYHIEIGENYYLSVEGEIGEANAELVESLDIGGDLARGLFQG